MNVLIHGIATNMGGAKRHLDNMIQALTENDDGNVYYVIVNDRYETPWKNERAIPLRFPLEYSNGLRRIVFDNWHVNRLIDRYSIHLLISFANFGPFKAKCKHMLFEMNALYFCENIKKFLTKKQRIDYAIKRLLIKTTGRNADMIVTPSRSLKEQIVQRLGLSETKMEVQYHAIEKRFHEASRTAAEMADPDKTYFLYPSHLARHKGVHILVEALKILNDTHGPALNFEVICTFDRNDHEAYYDELIEKIERYGIGHYIRFIGHVPQNAINRYYASADFMIYTTLCESFGFSMLEAKVFRLPALCSDIAINREIAKNAAKYYASENPHALADSIMSFLELDPQNLDFNFDDELLHWDWAKYAVSLRKKMERTVNG